MKNLFQNKKISIQILPYILFLSAFIPLAAAYISQYGFGLKPCELCIIQRIPFFIILGLTAAYIIFQITFRLSQKFLSCLLGACALAYIANIGVAFFHVGVEFKWWHYGECSAEFAKDSFEAFKASILAAKAVRCDEPQFMLFGISMAGYNFLLNIFYLVSSVLTFRVIKNAK